jgi:hypothetical protein
VRAGTGFLGLQRELIPERQDVTDRFTRSHNEMSGLTSARELERAVERGTVNALRRQGVRVEGGGVQAPRQGRNPSD